MTDTAIKRRRPAKFSRHAAHWQAELPEDDEGFRLALIRRMHDIRGAWQQCPLALCRRARSCAGSTFACSDPKPMSAQMTARVQAQMFRALKKRAAQASVEEEKVAAQSRRNDHQASNRRPKS